MKDILKIQDIGARKVLKNMVEPLIIETKRKIEAMNFEVPF